MEDPFEKALRFLWEKQLEQLGIQVDITIIKKSELKRRKT